MVPNEGTRSRGVLHEGGSLEQLGKAIPEERLLPDAAEPPQPYRHHIVWRKVFILAYLHAGALYAVFLIFTSAKLITTIYAILMYMASLLGVTAGAHRLWSHRSYQAKWPMRVFLMLLQTLAFHSHIYEWARDHRMHHKFCDTDADPHNAKRGFFFAHLGWTMIRKHPAVKAKGQTMDLSDLRADPVIMFQKKYYFTLLPIVYFVIPTVIPMYFWSESFLNAWFVGTVFRMVIATNLFLLINSGTHAAGQWGNKPYDRHITITDHFGVSFVSTGEGWHNYHHVFPWDYKAAELGNYRANFATAFIDMCARLGLAYDLKTVPVSIIEKRVKRTGDGSHPVWGWGDKDMSQEIVENVVNGKTAIRTVQ